MIATKALRNDMYETAQRVLEFGNDLIRKRRHQKVRETAPKAVVALALVGMAAFAVAKMVQASKGREAADRAATAELSANEEVPAGFRS